MFSLLFWYSSQLQVTESVCKVARELPLCQDVQQIVLSYLICDKCNIIHSECCCWMLFLDFKDTCINLNYSEYSCYTDLEWKDENDEIEISL